MYERVLAIVPLIGAGTLDDPIRPEYAPAPSAINPTSRTGILGYIHVLSDDGKSALVEYVARDRSAFNAILFFLTCSYADQSTFKVVLAV